MGQAERYTAFSLADPRGNLRLVARSGGFFPIRLGGAPDAHWAGIIRQ